MRKYYFTKNAENCYTLDHHKSVMKFNLLNELELFEAIIHRGSGFFYCKCFGEVGESNGTCGKECHKYKPRNGKSGICIFHRPIYLPVTKPMILKI